MLELELLDPGRSGKVAVNLNLKFGVTVDTQRKKRADIDISFPISFDPVPIPLPLAREWHRIALCFEARRAATPRIRHFGGSPDFLPCSTKSVYQLGKDRAEMAPRITAANICDDRNRESHLQASAFGFLQLRGIESPQRFARGLRIPELGRKLVQFCRASPGLLLRYQQGGECLPCVFLMA